MDDKVRIVAPGGRAVEVDAAAYEAARAAVRDELREAELADEGAKNRGFRMVFEQGWRRIRALADASPAALKVWSFLAEHAGSNGALMVAQEDIGGALGMNVRTIRRAIAVLDDCGAVFTLREAGGNIYCLDPDEVWSMAHDAKPFAPFNTKAIFSERAKGLIKRRLSVAKFQAPALAAAEAHRSKAEKSPAPPKPTRLPPVAKGASLPKKAAGGEQPYRCDRSADIPLIAAGAS